MIAAVEPDSPAAQADLEQGDVILALNGEPVGGIDDLVRLLNGDRIGQIVDLTLLRRGEMHTIASIGCTVVRRGACRPFATRIDATFSQISETQWIASPYYMQS